MAFETKNKAKKFGNRFAAKKYDEHHPAEDTEKSAAPKMGAMHEDSETPDFEAGEKEGAEELAPKENPAEVVKKHGKALHVHTSHDHAANKHHVHSVHPDGHVHDSDHASEQEATGAAKQLGGSDEMAEAPMEDAGAPEPDGFQMPRLA